MFLLSHSLVRLEDSCIINTTLLIGDHVWCTIESRTRSSRETSFSLSGVDRILYFSWLEAHPNTEYLLFVLLTWSSFEHGVLASRFDFCISAWSHRNDLKNHYDRDLRIWQARIDRDVCRDRRKYVRLTIASELSFSVTSSIGPHVVLAEVSMILWPVPCGLVALQGSSRREVNLLFCSGRRFPRGQSRRIELL